MTYEIFYSDPGDINSSAELEVFENGLKSERFGISAEYTINTTGGLAKIVKFNTAPLPNHTITVEYREFVSKT
jgi:hypothetical protein